MGIETNDLGGYEADNMLNARVYEYVGITVREELDRGVSKQEERNRLARSRNRMQRRERISHASSTGDHEKTVDIESDKSRILLCPRSKNRWYFSDA